MRAGADSLLHTRTSSVCPSKASVAEKSSGSATALPSTVSERSSHSRPAISAGSSGGAAAVEPVGVEATSVRSGSPWFAATRPTATAATTSTAAARSARARVRARAARAAVRSATSLPGRAARVVMSCHWSGASTASRARIGSSGR